MKKIYLSPVIKEIKIKVEQQICAGSPISIGNTPTDAGEAESKEEDIEDILNWIE